MSTRCTHQHCNGVIVLVGVTPEGEGEFACLSCGRAAGPPPESRAALRQRAIAAYEAARARRRAGATVDRSDYAAFWPED